MSKKAVFPMVTIPDKANVNGIIFPRSVLEQTIQEFKGCPLKVGDQEVGEAVKIIMEGKGLTVLAVVGKEMNIDNLLAIAKFEAVLGEGFVVERIYKVVHFTLMTKEEAGC